MCLIVGHRGACGYLQDNTIQSVEKAIELGVDMIEVDVRISKDNRLVAVHDDNINGVSVSNFSAQELYDMYNVPLIEEVLSTVNDQTKLLLDVKHPYDINLLSSLLSSVNRRNIFVTSICGELIKTLKNKYNDCTYGLVEDDDEILYPNSNYDFVILRHSDISLTRVKLFNKCGVKVFVYTVNTYEDIHRCNRCNVNGIVSDYPDRIKVK